MDKDSADDESEFAALFKNAKRIHSDRITPHRERPDIIKQTREQSPSSAQNFASPTIDPLVPIDDSYFDTGIQNKLRRKIRQGALPIDDRLDLHGMIQKTALNALNDFFQQALSSGFKSVIVVHGKGNRSGGMAVLKPLLHHWLSQQNTVLAWCPAQLKDGGSGASYVYLR